MEELNGINTAIIKLLCVRRSKTCLLGYFGQLCRLIFVGDGAKSLPHCGSNIWVSQIISLVLKCHYYYILKISS